MIRVESAINITLVIIKSRKIPLATAAAAYITQHQTIVFCCDGTVGAKF